MNGIIVTGPVEHKTNNRFRNMVDFESYKDAIDVDYFSGDVIFTGYVHKLNTPQVSVGEGSAYAKGTSYMQEIVQDHGQNCNIPASGHCFIKCNNYVTKRDNTEELLVFIRTEKYRSGVMTSAGSQPFCRK